MPVRFNSACSKPRCSRTTGARRIRTAGDWLIGSFARDAALQMPLNALTVVARTDRVTGRCMPNAPYKLVVRHRRFFGFTDSTGRFDRDLTFRIERAARRPAEPVLHVPDGRRLAGRGHRPLGSYVRRPIGSAGSSEKRRVGRRGLRPTIGPEVVRKTASTRPSTWAAEGAISARRPARQQRLADRLRLCPLAASR